MKRIFRALSGRYLEVYGPTVEPMTMPTSSAPIMVQSTTTLLRNM
jgi:hypothetical protein